MKLPSLSPVTFAPYTGNTTDLPRYLEDLHDLASAHNVMGALLGPVEYRIMYGLNNHDETDHVPWVAKERPVIVDDPTPGQVAIYQIRLKEFEKEFERDSLLSPPPSGLRKTRSQAKNKRVS